MSESDNDTDGKKSGKTLSIRRGGETGRVRQSFSHGRTKSVVVEKKRKRLVNAKDGASSTAAAPAEAPKPKRPARGDSAQGDGGAQRSRGKQGRGAMLQTLSEEEYARRVKALEAAKRAEDTRRKEAEAEAKRKAAEEAERKQAEEAEARRLAAEEAEASARAEEERKLSEEAAAKLRADEEAAKAKAAKDAEESAKAEAEAVAAAAPEPTPAPVEAPVGPAPEPAQAPAAEEPKPRRRRHSDEGPKTGDQVDISALTTALPGPKIISRAPPKPKEEAPAPRAAANVGPANTGGGGADGPRSRPKPTQADGDHRLGMPARAPSNREREERERAARANKAAENKRRSGKLTINQALRGDEGGRQRSLAAMRRRQEKAQRKQKSNAGPAAKVVRDVQIPDAITVQELSNRMAERGADVIKVLMKMDMMMTINQSIDADTAQLIVEEFGHRFSRVSEADVEVGLVGTDDPEDTLEPRAPIVTIMGHVDHGKTSLLDKLRSANVVAGEAGGITQHIGAYQVKTDKGVVSFLDTPGHAAFTAMRARGAQVTDIVILVVAADDSVMPQTIEAISHAKAAGVPMIVAINKIDKPAADAQKVRTELLQHDVQVEGMGGEVIDVEVSAMTGQGLDNLLDSILLQAEVLELRANPDRAAEGVVVEAQLDTGRGAVATVLVHRGTLKVGDIFVVGEQWGKVRALIDDHGDRTKEAGPSVPVEVLGLTGTPEAGDTLVVVENEKRAQEIAEYRQRVARDKQAAQGARGTLDQLLAQAKADENVKELPIVVKADVQGSNEAILQALEKIGNDEVKVRILHSGVGAITESDVTLAEASGAPIIGFNVRANAPARESANQKGVEIRYYSIIYDLVDDIKAAASGLLSPEIKETFIGYAEILEVFRISNVGNVAGCRVTEGLARRSAGVRLLRDNVVIHEGKLKTLKRFKDEVKEVQGGQECGMAFERYEDMRKGDVIEIFETQEVERTL